MEGETDPFKDGWINGPNGERTPLPPMGNAWEYKPPASTPVEPPPVRPTSPPTSQEMASAEFRRYGKELLPGAAEQLTKFHSTKFHSTFESRLGAAAEALTGFGERFRNPEFITPTGENGQPLPPLRIALGRIASDLKEGAIGQIYDKLAVTCAGLDEVKVARQLGRFLDRPEGRAFLSERWRASQFRVEPRSAEPARKPDGQFAKSISRKHGSYL